jgi:hypothetical protein
LERGLKRLITEGPHRQGPAPARPGDGPPVPNWTPQRLHQPLRHPERGGPGPDDWLRAVRRQAAPPGGSQPRASRPRPRRLSAPGPGGHAGGSRGGSSGHDAGAGGCEGGSWSGRLRWARRPSAPVIRPWPRSGATSQACSELSRRRRPESTQNEASRNIGEHWIGLPLWVPFEGIVGCIARGAGRTAQLSWRGRCQPGRLAAVRQASAQFGSRNGWESCCIRPPRGGIPAAGGHDLGESRRHVSAAEVVAPDDQGQSTGPCGGIGSHYSYVA